jgi:hypothetical protein
MVYYNITAGKAVARVIGRGRIRTMGRIIGVCLRYVASPFCPNASNWSHDQRKIGQIKRNYRWTIQKMVDRDGYSRQKLDKAIIQPIGDSFELAIRCGEHNN